LSEVAVFDANNLAVEFGKSFDQVKWWYFEVLFIHD
jgi:hypothetical protein